MTELKLPRLHRGTKGAELSDTGDPAASEQTATSFEPTGTKKTYYRDNDPSDKSKTRTNSGTPKKNDKTTKSNNNNANPFRIPTDEEIFVMRDEERKRNLAEREQMKQLKVHEKLTATYKNSSANISLQTNDSGKKKKKKRKRNDTETVVDEDSKFATLGTDSNLTKPQLSASLSRTGEARKSNVENLSQFVASKREMFLMSYSLAVKRDEMKKLTNIATDREEALKKAEKTLEDDAARFDAFLKENNIKTMDATKRADAETKAKLDKVQEIKRYTAQIGAIKNEMAKYDEQLEDCKKYKDFLDRLTPTEWFEDLQIKSKGTVVEQSQEVEDTTINIPMYFTKPEQLLSIFKSLEESNMFLIQNSQETEKVLEELRQNLKETETKLEAETTNLKSQICVLEESLEREEQRWKDLEEKAFKNFGMINSTSQETILQDLYEKVAEVYKMIVGINLSTLTMLTNIEHYMEELFKQQDNLPTTYLNTAIKAKEKEHRLKQRVDKLEKQKTAQEQRIKKSLERSQAPIKKKQTKPVMFRSYLPKETSEKLQDTINNQTKEEEEMHYFGLIP